MIKRPENIKDLRTLEQVYVTVFSIIYIFFSKYNVFSLKSHLTFSDKIAMAFNDKTLFYDFEDLRYTPFLIYWQLQQYIVVWAGTSNLSKLHIWERGHRFYDGETRCGAVTGDLITQECGGLITDNPAPH